MYSIKISTQFIEEEVPFCSSKFWGNPDMPESFEIPTYKDDEGDEAHYTFVCQINCNEIAHLDPDNKLPHKGMLYFFAKIGYYAGDVFFNDPLKSGLNKDAVKVFYYPKDDYKNFEQMILLDDDDEEVALREQKVTFTFVDEDKEGICRESHKLLGTPGYLDDNIDHTKYELLLQLDSCDLEDGAELNFMDCGMFYFLQPIADKAVPTFKNVRGYLASS